MADVTGLIEKFCEKNNHAMVDSVRAELEALVGSSDSHGALDQLKFNAWMNEDRTVKLSLDNEVVEIPVGFAHIHKVNAYPEMATPAFR